MGLKIKVDGVEQPTNSDFEKTMDNDTKEMLWKVMDENTKLKMDLMMANAKLEQIRKMLSDG